MQAVSSVYGKIEALLLTYPGIRTAHSDGHYAHLLDLFSDQADVIKFVNPAEATRIRSDLDFEDIAPQLKERPVAEIRRSFDVEHFLELAIEELEVGDPLMNTEWAQDAFVVMTGPDGRQLLRTPYYPGQLADHFVATQLAADESLDISLKPTSIHFEGGNLLVGDTYAIAGKDMLAKNCIEALARTNTKHLDHAHVDAVEDRIKRAFGISHILWAGFPTTKLNLFNRHRNEYTFQPAFHVDLFLTLAGRTPDGRYEIVLLGEPNEANRLLRSAFGRQLPSAGRVGEDFAEMKACFDNWNRLAVKDMPKFKVISVPMLYHQGTLYSVNNCLIEVAGDHRIAYLPDYRVPAEEDYELLNPAMECINEHVFRIFGDLGFVVHWIQAGRHFRRLAQRRGALHCIAKVLRRSLPSQHRAAVDFVPDP